MNTKLVAGLVVLVVSLVLASCDGEPPTRNIDVIRIGILPDQSGNRSVNKYARIFERIEKQTGIKVDVILPSSYQALVQAFENGGLDMTYFGGVTFLTAHKNSGAVPLVMRDIDMVFRSYFLVRSAEIASGIKELQGKKLSFGSKLSTSGHLMPRYFMMQENLVPEVHFGEVLYSGAHDTTALWVRDGKADIGAVNADVIDRMYAEGAIRKSQVRILVTTPPYPDYVWAIQAYVPQDLKIMIRDVFTKLSPSDKEDREILLVAGAGQFVPASMKDFEQLQQVAEQLGVFEN